MYTCFLQLLEIKLKRTENRLLVIRIEIDLNACCATSYKALHCMLTLCSIAYIISLCTYYNMTMLRDYLCGTALQCTYRDYTYVGQHYNAQLYCTKFQLKG